MNGSDRSASRRSWGGTRDKPKNVYVGGYFVGCFGKERCFGMNCEVTVKCNDYSVRSAIEITEESHCVCSGKLGRRKITVREEPPFPGSYVFF